MSKHHRLEHLKSNYEKFLDCIEEDDVHDAAYYHDQLLGAMNMNLRSLVEARISEIELKHKLQFLNNYDNGELESQKD